MELATFLLLLATALALLLGRLSPFLWRDLAFWATMASSSLRCRRRLARQPATTLLQVFRGHARRWPLKPLLIFGDRVYTYGELDRLSDRAAGVLGERLGSPGGQAVAVLLPNEPAYLWTWLALAKLGRPMACLNWNVRGPALKHALEAAGASALLASAELRQAVEELLPALRSSGVSVFYLSAASPTPGVPALLAEIEGSPGGPPVPSPPRAAGSRALYIYTSGTTGLPKAAVVTEQKLLLVASLARICGVRASDVIYTTLPLYHSAGLLVGLGGCLELGATCVLREKFSASHFWSDCRRHNVSVIQYVGELMRYLCNTPQGPDDRAHGVRMALGNGLRAEVWREFQRRFGPVAIWEFYGATEGNAGFINYTGKVGAVGRANPFIKFFAPFELVRYDVEKDEPVRDHRGLCIPVPPGETGLLVIKITSHTPFHGYAGDAQKTEKKILRDVLAKGDAFFNSGDLLVMDQERFVYFQDRVGDTFRWKGENVATTEVEATLGLVSFIQEVNVYGVAVPGCEGRCGMAAVRLRPGAAFDGAELFAFTRDRLPGYAAPRFVRIQDSLQVTGTFKQCKTHLVREGFDPAQVRDRLFYRDSARATYAPLGADTFTAIQEGRVSL